MLLRLTAAFATAMTGLACAIVPASAQYYPAPAERFYGPPPPVHILPPVEFDVDEQPVVVVPSYRQGTPLPPLGQPNARTVQPYPAIEERYVPGPPGFVRPDRDRVLAPLPTPYGDAPGAEIQRGDIAPPRPPMGISPTQPAQAATPPTEPSIMSLLPPEDQPEVGEPKQVAPQFRRQLVDYRTKEPAGTIVIDTANTYLYLVLGNGQAMRYGIGVGREGFTWSGTERVSRMGEWPDWHPPEEMIERQPYLPRFMAGGEGNPLGARALYLGKTLFRIHGTNQPSTIGTFVSSGCVRLINGDISDLYERVKVGTRVVVLPGKPPATAQAQPPVAQGLPPATAQAQPAR